jgi:hypothetical protein
VLNAPDLGARAHGDADALARCAFCPAPTHPVATHSVPLNASHRPFPHPSTPGLCSRSAAHPPDPCTYLPSPNASFSPTPSSPTPCHPLSPPAYSHLVPPTLCHHHTPPGLCLKSPLAATPRVAPSSCTTSRCCHRETSSGWCAAFQTRTRPSPPFPFPTTASTMYAASQACMRFPLPPLSHLPHPLPRFLSAKCFPHAIPPTTFSPPPSIPGPLLGQGARDEPSGPPVRKHRIRLALEPTRYQSSAGVAQPTRIPFPNPKLHPPIGIRIALLLRSNQSGAGLAHPSPHSFGVLPACKSLSSPALWKGLACGRLDSGPQALAASAHLSHYFRMQCLTL